MQTKRIYIDSRCRLAGGSDTDFRYALKTPVEIERGTMGWVDGVVIPNVFNTVKTGHNDTLFVRETHGSTIKDRALVIEAGDYHAYSLAATLQTMLRAGSTLPGLWTVGYTSGNFYFSNSTTGHAQSADGGIIVPRSEIQTPTMTTPWGSTTSPVPPALSDERDACRLIGLLEGPANSPISSVNSLLTNAIDLLPYHQLFFAFPHRRPHVTGAPG